MKRKKILWTLGILVLILSLFFIDLLTKLLLTGINQESYFLGIVRINFMFNTGIAFGMAADNPVAMIVVTILTIGLIAGMIALYFTVFKKNTPVRVCLAIVIAGALGNLFDRLYFSIFGASNVPSTPGELYFGAAVRDFIDLTPIHLGVCNIADFCITLGAVALAFCILFIGPHAVFPLTKKWREEGKRLDAEKTAKKNGLTVEAEPARPSEADASAFEEIVVFSRSERLPEGPELLPEGSESERAAGEPEKLPEEGEEVPADSDE